MDSAETATGAGRPSGLPAPSPAKARIIAAALELFGRHGVGGTSLAMIAKSVGVTKAAVFHQFRTKDEIVLAAAGAELTRIEGLLDSADAEPSRDRARDVFVAHIVDLAVERRRTVGTLLNDPVIGRFFADHEQFRRVMHRMSRLLIGEETGPEARVRTAVLTAAISGAVANPILSDLDDDRLRAELLLLSHRLLDRPA